MLHSLAKNVGRALSVFDHLPGLRSATPPLNRVVEAAELAVRQASQELALQCAREAEAALQPGWSEFQTARFMRHWLADHGIDSYFHLPLVFFGDRTRYAGFTSLRDLRPSNRILSESDSYILDVGPIINGMACDISICGKVGQVPGYDEANALLADIRKDIPAFVKAGLDGSRIWSAVSNLIEAHGYDPIHHDSSYSFFGHRLNGTTDFPLATWLAKQGRQTYSEFFARGLAGQIWSGLRTSDLTGVWAVEPHIGGKGFGVKFEESLVITPDFIGWLQDWHSSEH